MPYRSRRVAIADADAAALKQSGQVLAAAGHEVILTATSSRQLASHHGLGACELVVADMSLVEAEGLSAVAQVLEQHHLPLILTSSAASDEDIKLASVCHPLAHLVKPVRPDDLRVAIVIAVQRFEELQALRAEAAGLREALDDRKFIERAKGIIMRQHGVTESEAFCRLKQHSHDQQTRIVDVAKSIVLVESAFIPKRSSDNYDRQ
jgi:AmiR/NasT family two-component response regulator